MFGLMDLGIIGIILLVIIILLIPFILTILVGIAFANSLGFTGIYWWAFIILFYLVVSAILSMIGV